jgi:hypothetical protein
LYAVSSLLAVGSQLPVMIVLVLGIVMAVSRRRRNPAAASLALIGFVVALLSQLITIVVAAVIPLIPKILAEDHLPASVLTSAIGVVNVVCSLLAAIGWVLVIVALFRRPAATSAPAGSNG